MPAIPAMAALYQPKELHQELHDQATLAKMEATLTAEKPSMQPRNRSLKHASNKLSPTLLSHQRIVNMIRNMTAGAKKEASITRTTTRTWTVAPTSKLSVNAYVPCSTALAQPKPKSKLNSRPGATPRPAAKPLWALLAKLNWKASRKPLATAVNNWNPKKNKSVLVSRLAKVRKIVKALVLHAGNTNKNPAITKTTANWDMMLSLKIIKRVGEGIIRCVISGQCQEGIWT